ncbi:hypothetical protein JHD53_05700 [Peptacetobacter hiranonis]|uniref:hypothetical protein n=1 Tax=Peptacetobacter hiranonis TaxID=89152 RepID=UPI00191722BE|nr:hypothetical protein [Peptacetobacter hiranonis]QQQ87568.1 hypothetical protein JHD53_05700 [Peptacetobacter hiranonis]
MRNVIFIISMMILFLTLLVGLESIFTGGFQGLLRKSKLLIPLMLGYVILYSVYIFNV